MAKDMTEGNPTKILFLFAMPMLLGNLFQQLYNIADSIIVGNFVGPDALAAVGAAFPIVFLSTAITMGASMGCSIVIAQFFGAKQLKDVKSAITTAVISVTLLGVLFSIVGLIFCRGLLQILQTPSNILEQSTLYLNIIFLGCTFQFLYNSITAVFNALGDSKIPLACLIVAALLNIVLDIVFVVNFKMGVAGVAWATLIAQVISSLMNLSFLIVRLRRMKEIEKAPFFRTDLLKTMFRFAIPTIFQQSIVSFGMMGVQGLVNSYGSIVVAAYTAATKLDSLAMMPMINISLALSNFAGQNVGAFKPKRVKEGFKSAFKITVVFCIVITFIIYSCGRQLIGMFMDQAANNQVIEIGIHYLQVVSLFYIVMGIMFLANGVLRGTGDIKVFVISSVCNLTTRVGSAYLLALIIGRDGIWWSIPIGWIVGSIISMSRYLSNKWQTKGIITQENKEDLSICSTKQG